MAGSIRLHWKERLTDDELYAITEILERFEGCDDECLLHDEFTSETELLPHEIETIIEEFMEEFE